MLARAPYQVTLGNDKERNGEAKSGLHAGGTLRIITGEIGTPVSEDERGGESGIPSPHGKKRAASEDLEAETPKQGKKTSPEGFVVDASPCHAHQRASPPTSRKSFINSKV